MLTSEMQSYVNFLSGALTMGLSVIALFFLRFYRQTKERLFLAFATSFTLLAVERWVLLFYQQLIEEQRYVYVLRLAAFIVLGLAVLDKNRRPKAKRMEMAGVEHASSYRA